MRGVQVFRSRQLLLICGTFLAVLLCVIFTTEEKAFAINYYVDSVNGDDTKDGESESNAWKNLDNVNSKTFTAGDRLYLKSGSIWNGQQLYPKGSGASGNPIIVDLYGGTTKPIINQGGGATGAIYLYNQEYWEFNNLELTNDSAAAGNRLGVKIIGENKPTIDHIYIKNCYIHNVKGDLGSKTTGGIGFIIQGTTTATQWNDILIEGNTISNVDRTGIFTVSSWSGRGGVSGGIWTGSTNIVIKNNTLSDIGGDGVTIRAATSPLVEYNVAYDTGARARNSNAAFWPFNSDGAVFQYNEAYNTRKLSGNNDGQGFDIDWNTNNSLFQYNYSHDNEGGFMLICQDGSAAGSFNTGGVVRYNISQNDKIAVFSVLGPVDYSSHQSVYNNTVYLSPSSTAYAVFHGSWGGYANYIRYYNNIFYNLGSGGYLFNGNSTRTGTGGGSSSNNVFNYNVFYGKAAPSNGGAVWIRNTLASDPKLVNAGSGGNGLGTVNGYKLLTGSPAIGSGILITGNGGKDYWGNAVSSSAAPHRGAYNGPGQ